MFFAQEMVAFCHTVIIYESSVLGITKQLINGILLMQIKEMCDKERGDQRGRR
jgi:hypothetical protein